MATPPFLAPDPAQHLEPPAGGTEVEHLLDGSEALPRMLADIRTAKGPQSFVYHTAWNCQHRMVVQGPTSGDSFESAISAAADAGAEVRILLWSGTVDSTTGAIVDRAQQLALKEYAASKVPNQVNNQATKLAMDGFRSAKKDIVCELNNKTLLAGTHHQKILVIGTDVDVIAYCGGIEFSADRISDRGIDGKPSKGAPLFDMSLRLKGPGAYSLLTVFSDRWAASVTGATLRGIARKAPAGAPPTSTKKFLDSQVSLTYGAGCPFPSAIRTAGMAIAAAIRSTRQFFYIEDQYFVGTDELRNAIRNALRPDTNRWGVVVIANEDCVVDLPDVGYRRREMLRPLVKEFPGRFFVFERLGDDGTPTGRTAYVHSKLTIVDDITAVCGSANCNYRGWTHDTEVMITLADRAGPGGPAPSDWRPVRALRAALWQRQLHADTDRPPLPYGEPGAALPRWREIWVGKRVAHVRAYDVNFVPPRPMGTLSAKIPPAFRGSFPQISTAEAAALDGIWTTILDPRG